MRPLLPVLVLLLAHPVAAFAPVAPALDPILADTGAQGWLDVAQGLSITPTTPAAGADLAGSMARLYDAMGLAPVAIEASLTPAQDAALGALVGHIADAWGRTDLDAALELVAAMRAFRGSGPTAPFADPYGLVLVGTEGPDAYASDAVLIVDPAGDDLYLNSAGGACMTPALVTPCNELAVSVVLDLAGNDRYDSTGRSTQGSGYVGIGILADAGGDDDYRARVAADGFAQGASAAGVGILLDAGGDDVRTATLVRGLGYYYVQGAGILGGVGIAADADGADAWRVEALEDDAYSILAQGAGDLGGVGILHQGGTGATRYEVVSVNRGAEMFVGGASFGSSFGILFDAGGDDVHTIRAAAARWSNSVLAFGAADALGFGLALDAGGNDVWDVELGNGGIAAEGQSVWYNDVYAIFVDAAGDDVHRFVADHMAVQAMPTVLTGWALYLDGGGRDTYIGGRIADSPFGVEFAATAGV